MLHALRRIHDKPLVSVLLPVRNAGPYLEVALASLSEQVWENFEVLLVDDHSSDGALTSSLLCDARFSLITNEGRGIVAALNTAARHARGDFFARMDADDIAFPHRIQNQMEFLLSRPEIAIAGAQVEIFSDTADIGNGYLEYEHWINSLTEPEQIAREMFVESPLPHPTAMFHRDVLVSLGGYHDTDWPEDYDLWLRAHSRGLKLAKPNGVLLRWRDHGKRLSRVSKRYSSEQFLEAKAEYLSQGPLRDRSAVIWGAGPTGRRIFDSLYSRGSTISGFIDVHPRRIGGFKRARPVWPPEQINLIKQDMVLVAVGTRGVRSQIRNYMAQAGKNEGNDYLFVA